MQLYRRGDTGAAVVEVQATLRQLGLLEDLEDGFGEATDRAVRTFQQQRGVSIDGIVGPETYRALTAARWQLGARLLSLASNPYVGDDVVRPAGAPARARLRRGPGRRRVRAAHADGAARASSASTAWCPTACAAWGRCARSSSWAGW